MQPLYKRLKELGYPKPTAGQMIGVAVRLRREGYSLKKQWDYSQKRQLSYISNNVPDTAILEALSKVKPTKRVRPTQIPLQLTPKIPKVLPPLTKEMTDGIEPTPYVLLQLFHHNGLFGKSQLDKLAIVAKSLNEECNLIPSTTKDKIADQIKVIPNTASIYLNTFKNAYNFLHNQDNREQTLSCLKSWNPAYRGVQALLNQKIDSLAVFQQVKEDILSKVQKDAKRPLSVEEADRLITQHQEEVRKLKAENQSIQTEKDRLTQEMLRTNQVALGLRDTIAELKQTETGYLNEIERLEQARDSLSETAKGLQSELESRLDLPSHIVWQDRWAEVKIEPYFKDNYIEMMPSQKKAIKQMLMSLSLSGPSYPSLQTKSAKKFGKQSGNPPGVPDECFYSRASDKIRVYWNVIGDKFILYRVDIKGA